MRRLLPAVAVIAAALLGAGFASGELTQSGNVRLALNGGFEPRLLPRNRMAPVSFDLSGSIVGVNGTAPPPVRSLSIAVNRYGRISTRGLPVCLRGRLQQTSTQEALARCRPALIGRGRFTANVDFSNGAFSEEGAALAFNGRAGRHSAILLQIHGDAPVEATIVLVFKVSHPRQGPFGTVFTATIPKIASDLGYVSKMGLTFDRRYRFDGRLRSFLSARCVAPRGFPSVVFSFARGSFVFANGQRLSLTLPGHCRALPA